MSKKTPINKKNLEKLVEQVILSEQDAASGVISREEDAPWYKETPNQVWRLTKSILSKHSRDAYYGSKQVYQAMDNIELSKYDKEVKSFFAIYSDFDFSKYKCTEIEQDMFNCDVFFNPTPYNLARPWNNLLSHQKLTTVFSPEEDNYDFVKKLKNRAGKTGKTSPGVLHSDEYIKRPESQPTVTYLEEQSGADALRQAREQALQRLSSGEDPTTTVKAFKSTSDDLVKKSWWEKGKRESERRKYADCPLDFDKENYRSEPTSVMDEEGNLSDEDWCKKWKSGIFMKRYSSRKAGELFNDGVRKDIEFFNYLKRWTANNGEYAWVDGITDEEYNLQMKGRPGETLYIPGMRPDTKETEKIKKKRELYQLARNFGKQLASHTSEPKVNPDIKSQGAIPGVTHSYDYDPKKAPKISSKAALTMLKKKASQESLSLNKKDWIEVLEFFWLHYYEGLHKLQSKYKKDPNRKKIAPPEDWLNKKISESYINVYEYLLSNIESEFGGLGLIDSGSGRPLVKKYFLVSEQEAKSLANLSARVGLHPQLFGLLCFKGMHSFNNFFSLSAIRKFALNSEKYLISGPKVAPGPLADDEIVKMYQRTPGEPVTLGSKDYNIREILYQYVKKPIFKKLKSTKSILQVNKASFAYHFGAFSMLMRLDPSGEIDPDRFLEIYKDYAEFIKKYESSEEFAKSHDKKDWQASGWHSFPALLLVSTPEMILTSKVIGKFNDKLTGYSQTMRDFKAGRKRRARQRRDYKRKVKKWKKAPKASRGAKPKRPGLRGGGGKGANPWMAAADYAMNIAPFAITMATYAWDPLNVIDRNKMTSSFNKATAYITETQKKYKESAEKRKKIILDTIQEVYGQSTSSYPKIIRQLNTIVSPSGGSPDNEDFTIELDDYLGFAGSEMTSEAVSFRTALENKIPNLLSEGEEFSSIALLRPIFWRFDKQEMDKVVILMQKAIDELLREYAVGMDFALSAMGEAKDKANIREKIKATGEVFGLINLLKTQINDILKNRDDPNYQEAFVFNHLNTQHYIDNSSMMLETIQILFDKYKNPEVMVTFENKNNLLKSNYIHKYILDENKSIQQAKHLWFIKGASLDEEKNKGLFVCVQPADEEDFEMDTDTGGSSRITVNLKNLASPLDDGEKKIFQAAASFVLRGIGKESKDIRYISGRMNDLKKSMPESGTILKKFDDQRANYIAKYENNWKSVRNQVLSTAATRDSQSWSAWRQLSRWLATGLLLELSPNNSNGFFSSDLRSKTYFLGLPLCFGSTKKGSHKFPSFGFSGCSITSSDKLNSLLNRLDNHFSAQWHQSPAATFLFDTGNKSTGSTTVGTQASYLDNIFNISKASNKKFDSFETQILKDKEALPKDKLRKIANKLTLWSDTVNQMIENGTCKPLGEGDALDASAKAEWDFARLTFQNFLIIVKYIAPCYNVLLEFNSLIEETRQNIQTLSSEKSNVDHSSVYSNSKHSAILRKMNKANKKNAQEFINKIPGRDRSKIAKEAFKSSPKSRRDNLKIEIAKLFYLIEEFEKYDSTLTRAMITT